MASNYNKDPKHRITVHKKIFMDPNLIQAQKAMMIHFEEICFNNHNKGEDYAFLKPNESEYATDGLAKKIQLPVNQFELYFNWLVQNGYILKDGEKYRLAETFPE